MAVNLQVIRWLIVRRFYPQATGSYYMFVSAVLHTMQSAINHKFKVLIGDKQNNTHSLGCAHPCSCFVCQGFIRSHAQESQCDITAAQEHGCPLIPVL